MTVYAPDFFALLGTKGQKEKLFATATFEQRVYCSIYKSRLYIRHYRLHSLPCENEEDSSRLSKPNRRSDINEPMPTPLRREVHWTDINHSSS
jgi:hypothetical protein